MYINEKSIINKEELIGASQNNKYIEIQMYNEYENKVTTKEMYDIITGIPDIDVRVVHSPIGEDVLTNIEYVDNEECNNRLSEAIELSGMLSKYYNHNIKVIIHSALSEEDFVNHSFYEKAIKQFFDKYFYQYPLLEFCFENVIPFELRNNNEIKKILFRNGVFFDSVNLAKRFNEIYNTNRFGTVLDTCHAMVTQAVVNNILKNGCEEYMPDVDLETYFKANQDVCKIIHLADVEGLGIEPHTHGIGFTSKKKMRDIVNLYYKYNYTADVTIEIIEENYLDKKNFRKNKKLLLDILE